MAIAGKEGTEVAILQINSNNKKKHQDLGDGTTLNNKTRKALHPEGVIDGNAVKNRVPQPRMVSLLVHGDVPDEKNQILHHALLRRINTLNQQVIPPPQILRRNRLLGERGSNHPLQGQIRGRRESGVGSRSQEEFEFLLLLLQSS